MPEALRPNPPRRYAGDPEVAAAKAALRATIRAARRTPEPPGSAARRTASARRLCAGHDVIALYCSIGDEPDTWPLIDALSAAGRTVLLPVLGRRSDGTVRREPDWAEYAGPDALRVGYAGIAEPLSEPVGPDGLQRATLVWCSALAATSRGDRLGAGGGWYDRALAHASPDALLGVLLRDDEVLSRLPLEAFDLRVDVIVTDLRTIRAVDGPE